MWFDILPAYLIVTASIMIPGYATWWAHYFVLGNVSMEQKYFFGRLKLISIFKHSLQLSNKSENPRNILLGMICG